MVDIRSLALKWNVSEKAAALHSDARVCDMTLPWGAPNENKEITLPRYPESGFDFVSMSVGIDGDSLAHTVHYVASVKNYLKTHANKYVFVKSVDEILKAKSEGKFAVGFNFQGSEMLEGDKNLVEVFYDLGVRHMLLAYNQKNKAADGCHERTDSGLSRYGISLIQEMNRVGMIVDLTHMGYCSSMEAMEISKAPVIFSHSDAYTLKNHPRNIRDDQIKGCARKGGIIGVVGIGHFLGNNEASTENMVRHIDYIVNLVGPGHVGIGLDLVYYQDSMYRRYLEQRERYPEGYPPDSKDWNYFQPEQLPEITDALLKRNYSENDIRGILGQNFIRVAGQVWKT